MKMITPEKLCILRHAIGYADDGSDRFPNARSMDERRNHFVTGADHKDGKLCTELTNEGLMHDHGARESMGGDHLFTVTDAGRAVVLEHKPVPPKISPGRQRYREFLRADCGMKFIDWLKRRKFSRCSQ